MRKPWLLCLAGALALAGPASATFICKGWLPGTCLLPLNLPVPENLEIDPDQPGPEFIIYHCYNGQCDIGLTNLVTGITEWVHFSDWIEPPETVAYVDIDDDGLLDAVIPGPGLLAFGCTSSGAVGDPVGEPRTGAPLSLPNPALDRCQIAFATAVAGQVDVTIFDVSGRLVRSVLSGDLPAGAYNPTWDGCDASGVRLPAGMYLARVATPERERDLKIVLAR